MYYKRLKDDSFLKLLNVLPEIFKLDKQKIQLENSSWL